MHKKGLVMGVPDRLSAILDTQVMSIEDLSEQECAALVIKVAKKIKPHLGSFPGIERFRVVAERIQSFSAGITIPAVYSVESETGPILWNANGRVVFLATLHRSDNGDERTACHLLMHEVGTLFLWRYTYKETKSEQSTFELVSEESLSSVITGPRTEALLNSLGDKLEELAKRAETRAEGLRALEQEVSRINRRLDVKLRLT